MGFNSVFKGLIQAQKDAIQSTFGSVELDRGKCWQTKLRSPATR